MLSWAWRIQYSDHAFTVWQNSLLWVRMTRTQKPLYKAAIGSVIIGDDPSQAEGERLLGELVLYDWYDSTSVLAHFSADGEPQSGDSKHCGAAEILECRRVGQAPHPTLSTIS
jgi:hypothetical protein